MTTTWQADDNRYDQMTYNRCGRSGLDLPALSLGLWHNFGAVADADTATAMVRRAFDLGITHFDLANKRFPFWNGACHFIDIAAPRFQSCRGDLLVDGHHLVSLGS